MGYRYQRDHGQDNEDSAYSKINIWFFSSVQKEENGTKLIGYKTRAFVIEFGICGSQV